MTTTKTTRAPANLREDALHAYLRTQEEQARHNAIQLVSWIDYAHDQAAKCVASRLGLVVDTADWEYQSETVGGDLMGVVGGLNLVYTLYPAQGERLAVVLPCSDDDHHHRHAWPVPGLTQLGALLASPPNHADWLAENQPLPFSDVALDVEDTYRTAAQTLLDALRILIHEELEVGT